MARTQRWSVVLSCACALLSACGGTSEPEGPQGPPLETVAGDLGLTCGVRVERYAADAVDTGDFPLALPFAACTLRTQSCEPDAIELKGCDTASLAQVEAAGDFLVAERARASTYGKFSLGGTSWRLGGGVDMVGGRPMQERDVTGGRFVLRSRDVGTYADGRPYEITQLFVGCSSPGPSEVRGCVVRCQKDHNNLPPRFATFAARRVDATSCAEVESAGLVRVAEMPGPATGAAAPAIVADVVVHRGHAYVVSIGGGLQVFDVSDPTQPQLRHAERIDGDDYWNAVWAHQDALYVASDRAGVRVYDLADPARPVWVRNATGGSTALNVHTVHVDGSLLFAGALNEGALLFDVSRPLEPVLLGRYSAGSSMVHDMRGHQGRLYVNNWGEGFHVVDVATPAAPRLLGKYTYPGSTSHATALGRFGERLIAFEGGEGLGAHLRVLDVTDPAQPRRLASYRGPLFASIHNFELVGTRLYVAYYTEGLRVLDVSDPEQPREVAHHRTWRAPPAGEGFGLFSGAFSVRVPGDGHVYVADGGRGLLVLREQ